MSATTAGAVTLRRQRLAGILFIGLLLVIAELAPRVGLIDQMLFRPTTEVFSVFLNNWLGKGNYEYVSHVLVTFQRFLLGFGLAVVVAFPLGIFMGRWSVGARYFVPVVNFFYPIPVSALIPVAMGVFGINHRLYAALVALACGIPIFLASLDAAQRVEKTLVETARTLGVRASTMFWRVLLPASLPGVITGVHVASALGVVVVIAAEMVASSQGMGWLVLHAQRRMRIADIYAGILLIACFGFVITNLTYRLGRLFIRWHTSAQEKRW